MSFIAASGDMAQPADRSAPGSTLRPRILSAIVLAPVALAAIFAGQPYFDMMIAAGALLMASEWRRLSGGRVADAVALVMIAGVVAAVAATAVGMARVACLAVLIDGAAVFALCQVLKEGRRTAASCMIGALVLGAFAISLVWLRGLEPGGLGIVIWLAVSIWLTDICAYFSGRAIGGVKLAPRISPNKTWAGLVGGMAGAAIWSAGWFAWSGAETVVGPLLAGMGTAVLAQTGDLGVSVLKRYFGAKDSGTLIPGHGGVLDRMDGFIGAAPFVALAFAIGGPGGNLWL